MIVSRNLSLSGLELGLLSTLGLMTLVWTLYDCKMAYRDYNPPLVPCTRANFHVTTPSEFPNVIIETPEAPTLEAEEEEEKSDYTSPSSRDLIYNTVLIPRHTAIYGTPAYNQRFWDRYVAAGGDKFSNAYLMHAGDETSFSHLPCLRH